MPLDVCACLESVMVTYGESEPGRMPPNLQFDDDEARALANLIDRTLAGQPETDEEGRLRLRRVGIYSVRYKIWVHTQFRDEPQDYSLNLGGWDFWQTAEELADFAVRLRAAADQNDRDREQLRQEWEIEEAKKAADRKHLKWQKEGF